MIFLKEKEYPIREYKPRKECKIVCIETGEVFESIKQASKTKRMKCIYKCNNIRIFSIKIKGNRRSLKSVFIMLNNDL